MAANHAQVVKWRDELTPNIVDQLAKAKPDGAYALYPKSPVTYEEGYRTITYKDFANAINGLAWWLKETLGPATDDNVVAYLGPNDIRYNALMLGANKAGYLVHPYVSWPLR
jgi:acyl-coenzyme A synthetase/AMP-(fatty) acid ligase